MIGIQNVQINGIVADVNPVDISTDGFYISWNYSPGSEVQNSIDLRVSTSGVGHGTDTFGRDIVDFNNIPVTGSIQRINFRRLVSRNSVLLAQLRIRSSSSISPWFTFKMRVASLPFISGASITPSNPSYSDNLTLTYTSSGFSAPVSIKWFKNGKEQFIIRDSNTVPSNLISPGDDWYASIQPLNYENEGIIFTTSMVSVSKPEPIVRNIEIFPRNATVDDVLEAVYKVDDLSEEFTNVEDETVFDWFVNDELVAESYVKFARLRTVEGDSVYVRARPLILGYSGPPAISDKIFVKKSTVSIYNILIDGQKNGSISYNPAPVITWEIDDRRSNDITAFVIKIGTANGSSDLGTFEVQSNIRSFKIPPDILMPGSEYFVSLIPVGFDEVLFDAHYVNFRTSGSLWNSSVNNSRGWTISCKLAIQPDSSDLFSGYAMIVSDGAYSFRIEIFKGLTRVIANSSAITEVAGDNSQSVNYLVGVQGRSLKVYRNGIPIFDIPNSLSTITNEKSVRFEPIVVNKDAYIVLYEMLISVLGRRLPGDSGYGDLSFYKVAEFSNAEVSAVAESGGKVLIGVNNVNPDNFPSIYQFNPLAPNVDCDVSSFNDVYFSVNSVSSSKVGNVVGVGTNRGVTIISGGNPIIWDSICGPISQDNFATSGWKIFADDINSSISFSSGSISINTKPSNSSPIVASVSDGKIQVISIQQRGVFETYQFSYNVSTKTITATPVLVGASLISLQFVCDSAKSIEKLVAEMLGSSCSSTDTSLKLSYFYNIIISNETGYLPSSYVSSVDVKAFASIYEVFIEADSVGVEDNPNLPLALPSGSKGSAYISQEAIGSPWYEYVNSNNGYTFELDIAVRSSGEALDSSNDANLSNLSFSDGSFKADVQLSDSMIKVGRKTAFIDLSINKRLRFTSHEGQVNVYEINSPNEDPILSFSMSGNSSDVGEVVKIKSTSLVNDVHAIALISNGTNSNYYHRVYKGGEWHDAGKIFKQDGDFGDFDVSVVGNDLIMVFEMSASGRSEVGFARMSSGGWSKPLRITSSIGDSIKPRVAVDDDQTIHVVWEDDRSGSSQIMYAYQTSSSMVWNSSAFGNEDLALTSNELESYAPAITCADGNVYVSFEEEDANTYSVRIIKKNIASGTWTGYAGSSTDTQVSALEALLPKDVNIEVDLSGRVHVLWTDLINSRRRVMHRLFDSSFTSLSDVRAITKATDDIDCTLESVGFNQDNGDILISIAKRTPSTTGQGIANSDSLSTDVMSRLAIARFDARIGQWRSSGSFGFARGMEYGGYDVSIITSVGDNRSMYGSCIPKIFKSRYPMIYKSIKDPEAPGKMVARSFAIDSDYLGRDFNVGQDPYLSEDDIIFGLGNEKYIRIGDYGGVLSTDITVSRLAIYGKSALAPLSINVVSPATYAMNPVVTSAVIVSSQKDAWFAGGNKIMFFDSARDAVFDATSGEFFTSSRLNQFITSGKSVIDIFFDKNGVFYVMIEASGERELLASLGGSLFAKMNMDIGDSASDPNSLRKVRIDGNGNAIISTDRDIRIVKQFSTKIREALIEYAEEDSEAEAEIDFTTEVISSLKFQSFEAQSASDGNVYFASSIGLIRCSIDGSVNVFGRNSGLNEGVVKFVTHGMNGRIFCATSTEIYEFVGNSFYRIDPFGYERSRSEIPPGLQGDIVGISCTYSNLIIACNQSIYIAYEVVGKGVGSSWSSRYIAKSSLDLNNDDLGESIARNQLKISSVDIERLGGIDNGVVAELTINGHRVSRGFGLSVEEEAVFIKAPLLASDKVNLVLRKDIYKLVDMKQNNTEIDLAGKEDRKIMEVGIVDGQYGCAISGTRSHIDLWNEQIQIPHDDIILDREPPVGKATLAQVVSNNVIKINISPLPEAGSSTDPFDKVSGIDKIVISNYDNFTQDGIVPSEPLPFSRDVLHTLNPVVSTGNIITDIISGYGTAITYIRFFGESRGRLVYATGSPASVYISDLNVSFETDPNAIFEGGSPDFEVTAIHFYRNRLFVAVGRRDGTGNATLLYTEDGSLFVPLGGVSGSRITGFSTSSYDNNMYFSVAGLSQPANSAIGELYAYDNSAIRLVATNLNSRANSVTSVDRFVYVGTGSPAKIYRYDIASGISEIVMSESESDVNALATVGAGVYAGMSQSSRILRSNDPSAPFVQSFVTIANDVSFGSAITINALTRPYFGVGNILFYYNNTWSAIGRADSNIVGACVDEFGSVFYISQDQIKTIAISAASIRNVFVKLIDRAGNETEIRSAPDEVPTGGDGYNDNLTIRITSESEDGQDLLFDSGLSNTIVEYNDNGEALYTLQGDAPFYSASRVEIEQGIYESPILSGASGHVSWGTISWTGSMPIGTDIEILIRSGETRSAIQNAPYSVSYSWPESGSDISFMPGSFIQFKIILKTAVDVSPRIDSLIITENAGSTSNLITTLFELPSKLKRGIITTDSQIPSSAAIIAGFTLRDATEFSEYQEVPIDRIFEPSSFNTGDKLRIGFKLISPRGEGSLVEPPPPDPNDPNTPLSLNTMQWVYENSLSSAIVVDFRVNFFSDYAMSNPLVSINTISNPQLFKVDSNPFPTDGGAVFASGQTRGMSLIPTGYPFACNTNYYVSIDASINGADFHPTPPARTRFVKQCGVNFLDVVAFNYVNQGTPGRFHFRINVYSDPERNNLVTNFFSYYGTSGWTANNSPYGYDGVAIASGESKYIQFIVPNSEDLSNEVTYYLVLQAYDLENPEAGFSFNDSSYSFRIRGDSTGTDCGNISNVPVIRGFCMMFELEDGRLVKMRFDG
jgi:hypothetical protein